MKEIKFYLMSFLSGVIATVIIFGLIFLFVPMQRDKLKPELYKVTYYTLSKADCLEDVIKGITGRGK